MKINYWDCEYQDCDHYYCEDEDGDIDIIYEYGCTHPNNQNSLCKLDNKWGSDCETCPLLKRL